MMTPEKFFSTGEEDAARGTGKVIAVVIAAILILVALGWWMIKKGRELRQGTPIEVTQDDSSQPEEYPLANEGDVSPISGLACENWNRRPMAVMQPVDEPARPLAGLSEADMVVEMPVLVDGKPRLMGIYVCGNPEEVGSMRSARHDFLHLAKGMDAIMLHWGGSQFAKEKLNEGFIDNINCNNDGGKSGGECCFRKEGMARGVDSGYAKFEEVWKCASEFGYRTEGTFSGYPHQGEAPLEDRADGGMIRIGFQASNSPNYVEFQYDKESNTYLRIWGGSPDFDRNTNERIAPKNVVALIADQELKIDDNDTPYNNVQLGDPWYDDVETGEAYYYFNGQEFRGKWRKNKSDGSSKLVLSDENGQDIKFVPGQIWLAILEPGRALKWTPGTATATGTTATGAAATATTTTTTTTTAQ